MKLKLLFVKYTGLLLFVSTLVFLVLRITLDDSVIINNVFFLTLGSFIGWLLYKSVDKTAKKINFENLNRDEFKVFSDALLNKIIIDYNTLKSNFTFLVELFDADRKLFQLLHKGHFKEFSNTDSHAFGIVIYIPFDSLSDNEKRALDLLVNKAVINKHQEQEASYFVINLGTDVLQGRVLLANILRKVYKVSSVNKLKVKVDESGSVAYTAKMYV